MSPAFTTRFLIRSDIKHVQLFEREFNDAWDEADFLSHIQDHKVIGLVALIKERPIGYVLYKLNSNRITVIRIAVDDLYHRQGIGTLLIKTLIEKLDPSRRQWLRIDAPEDNLGLHLFLKSLGCRATVVLPRSQKYRFVYPCIQTVGC